MKDLKLEIETIKSPTTELDLQLLGDALADKVEAAWNDPAIREDFEEWKRKKAED